MRASHAAPSFPPASPAEPQRRLVGKYERHEPVPPRVLALWIASLAFALLIGLLLLLSRA